ncbi:hypothetical protein JET76_24345 [Pseudomonas putida]|uniref:Uncharacterized protein n=1 Tax=Pseudomonas putida TaxID=303 RepID=A0A7W2QL01_PSEPU|nr:MULTISPECIES: hypothetical protein [Pseudomonas]MBA6118331.1 hypothetical protein [Pseudomonas putida]MBI6944458.1 hypothetical protein [Pseudomonas putida]MBI6958606.1 hypothetical protein [Pseudomonas putida]MEC4876788.1 hypothetical protein [Pseudomonas sp. NC26]PZQ37214.1 MAG: hypothetical protein DI560_22085 [Pseudomonas putida]
MRLAKALILALALPCAALAAERNDLQSCYTRNGLADIKPAGAGRELVVIIDQTIPMPDDLQRSSWAQIDRFVQPGDRVRLYTFSAFLPGEYQRLVYAGELDMPLQGDVRDDVNMRKLRALDQCLAGQKKAFQAGFGGLFVKGLRDARQDIPKSEIMNTLRRVGEDMSKEQGVDERVVYLISDMLEHSDYTSFYAANQIKQLNVANELKLAQSKGLYADLQGARVYVSGAGLVTDAVKHAYRSGKTMDALKDFWAQYLKASNATLEGFGTPSLSTDLR